MTERVKVAILVNSLLRGGAEAIAVDIATALDPSRFDVQVWCLHGTNGRQDFSGRLREAGVTTVVFGTKEIWKAIQLVHRQIRHERIKILHCHMPFSIIAGTVAGLFAGTRIIAHHHNTWAFNSAKINLMLRFLKPFAWHVCYSDTVERELFGGINVIDAPLSSIPDHCTILNFVDTNRITKIISGVERVYKRASLGLAPEDVVILSVGRLIRWKGQDTLIEALPMVVEKLPKARLLIAGDGPLAQPLRERARTLGIDGRVSFLGNRSDIYELFAASDVFAAPYHYGPEVTTRETVGVAIIEAMAAGLPVIVSDYPSIDKVVRDGENGIMVPPGDAKRLAEVLVSLCPDGDLRYSLGSSAREFVADHLSRDHTVPIYESLYILLASL